MKCKYHLSLATRAFNNKWIYYAPSCWTWRSFVEKTSYCEPYDMLYFEVFFKRWRSHGMKSILCVSLDQNLPLLHMTSWSLHLFWRDRVTYHIIGPTGSAHKHYVWTNNRIDQPFALFYVCSWMNISFTTISYKIKYTRVCIFSLKREEKLTGKPIHSLPNLVISVTFWIQM